jgi:hypothetical protein
MPATTRQQEDRARSSESPYLPEASLGGEGLSHGKAEDRWWLAISIVWLFLTLGALLYLGYA